MAEVASTCNEILILNYMINETKDRKEKFYLINQLAERFRTTLFRQAMFAEFETETYRLSWSGTPLTKDLLCSLYHELNSSIMEKETVIDEDIDHEWERIPHFYMQFYVTSTRQDFPRRWRSQGGSFLGTKRQKKVISGS